MLSKTLASATCGIALVAALAGCSADGSTKPSTSPSATASATVTPTTYNECVDGQATILASKVAKDFTLRGDCRTVSIVGQAEEGQTITLPALDLLVFEGDDATVEVASVKKIVFGGNDNTVRHGGPAEVDDQGTGNTATRK